MKLKKIVMKNVKPKNKKKMITKPMKIIVHQTKKSKLSL